MTRAIVLAFGWLVAVLGGALLVMAFRSACTEHTGLLIGAAGAVLFLGGVIIDPVDTTAAGRAIAGALATLLGRGTHS